MNISALAKRVDRIAKQRESELVVESLALDEGETIPTHDGKGMLIVRVFCKPHLTRGNGYEYDERHN